MTTEPTRTPLARRTAVRFVLLALVSGLAFPAGAAVVGDGTPGSCTSAALGEAVALGGTVTFSCGGAATIAGTRLVVFPGSPAAVVDGGGLITLDGTGSTNGIVSVYGGASALPELTLRSLTVTNGAHTTGLLSGGAIENGGVLVLEDVVFTGNRAYWGGAIAQQACNGCLEPSLVARRCTFRRNEGMSGGGAVLVGGGQAAIFDSTFEENTAGTGGALYVYVNSGQARSVVEVRGSTFAGNGDASGAGAVEMSDLGGKGRVTLASSTFAGNATTGPYPGTAGAIRGGGPGSLLSHVTVAGNGATAKGAGVALAAGTVVRGSVFSGNTPVNCAPDLEPGAGSGSNLQWGDASCAGFAPGDPLLGPLAANGGPTRTMKPGAGSAALDAIPRAACSEGKDQRGWLRPAGTGCDLGAVEVQAGGARLFVPAVLSAGGRNGSFFTSELTLANRGAVASPVTFDYAAFAGGGSGTLKGALTLAPGAQAVIADVVELLRGKGLPIPADGARAGTLAVTFEGLESAADASATVRTATPVPPASPIGRAGLAYAGVASGRLLTGPVVLAGLRETGADRSNVAVQNGATSGDVTLRLSVFLGSPASATPVSTSEVTLGPGGFEQRSLAELSDAASGKDAYVVVEKLAGSGPFLAYGVINDNPTSDGSYVDPVELGASPAGLTLPVVVETGTYDTELVVTNTSAQARVVRATLSADPIPAGSASIDLTVPAHGQLVIPRFVDALRQANAAGAVPAGPGYVAPLVLTGASGLGLAGVSVSARVGNPAPGGNGRFGLFFSAVPFGRSATDTLRVTGLQQDATNRSNLALVNTGEAGDDPVVLEVSLVDGAKGTEAAATRVEVPARRVVQIGKVLQALAPGTSQGYARVRRLRGTNPFLAYAVVNDGAEPGERSGDGAFLVGEE